MDGKTCQNCKHAKPIAENSSFPPEYLECENASVESNNMGHDYYRMYEMFLTDGNLIVSPVFGCASWEPKNQG